MRAIRIHCTYWTLLLFSVISIHVSAQDRPLQNGGGRGNTPFGQGERRMADTTRVERTLGQLINDSIQQVYGPHTTEYFTADSWNWEKNSRFNPDTLLKDLHRYSYLAKSGYQMQQLSAIASPSQAFFHPLPTQIGSRLGINALDYLLPTPQNWRFYNTKSPYSYWEYIQGGGGRSYLDAVYSRNVNPRSNIGFLYRRVISKPLVGLRNISGNDRQIDHQNIVLHGHYGSKNGRYKLMTYFSSYRQNMQETGGLSIPEGEGLATLFGLDEGLLVNRLDGAEGEWKGSDWYGQQVYQPFDSLGLKLFHEWRVQRTQHGYTDVIGTGSTSISDNPDLLAFYPNSYFSEEETQHQSFFRSVDTKAGIRWRRKSFFMGAYYRFRSPRWAQRTLGNQQISGSLPVEHYLGGQLALSIKDLFVLESSLEYLIFTEYQLKARLSSKWLEVSLTQQRYRPSVASLYRYGNHFAWTNDFTPSFSTELSGKVILDLGKALSIKPQVRLQNTSNLVFWNDAMTPEQLSNAVNFFQGGLSLNGQIGEHWHWEALGLYTTNTEEQAMPVPNLFANAQLYYENTLFKGNLPAQVGIDFHWHSAYYAYQYQPVLRQFHTQQDVQVGNYPLIEAFINAHINRVMIFAKGTNLLQNFVAGGYYLTPRYMAQPRQFEFGLIWRFFD